MSLRLSTKALALAGLVTCLGGVAANRFWIPSRISIGSDLNVLALYKPTPIPVIHRALAMAKVGPEDTVYDLGSGDGRVLESAARMFKARAVGIEINYALVRESRATLRRLGVESQVEVRWGDIFQQDLSPATVVFIFLPEDANRTLRPKLERELRPQTRIISYGSQIPGWSAVAQQEMSNPDRQGDRQTLYLYRR